VLPQLVECKSTDEVVSLVQKYISDNQIPSGSFVQGSGWDNSFWPGQQMPTKAILDANFIN